MKSSVIDCLTCFCHLVALFHIFHPMTTRRSIEQWSILTGSQIRIRSRNWRSHLSHVRSIQQRFCHSWICRIIQRGTQWRFFFWISNRCSHTKSSPDFADFIASVLRRLKNVRLHSDKSHERYQWAHIKLKSVVGKIDKLEIFIF